MIKKILISIVFCINLYANQDIKYLDAYSEFKYRYFNSGIHIKLYSTFKYEFNKQKNQYGSRDILLFSLKQLALEYKKNGYKRFYIHYMSDLNKYKISIDEYLNSFEPLRNIHVYNYRLGKAKKGSSLGSTLAFMANAALLVAGAKSSNIYHGANVAGQSLNGVMGGKGNLVNDTLSNLDKKGNINEIKALKGKMLYNTIELYSLADDSIKKFEKKGFIEFNVKEVEEYFTKKNQFRIKDLNEIKEHYIVRGITKL